MQDPSGVITTDAGTWVLTGPVTPSGFGNPEGHLVLTDGAGVVFLAGEILLIKPDQLVMLSATDSFTTVPVIGELILTKFTP
jgi:hypothetical protein